MSQFGVAVKSLRKLLILKSEVKVATFEIAALGNQRKIIIMNNWRCWGSVLEAEALKSYRHRFQYLLCAWYLFNCYGLKWLKKHPGYKKVVHRVIEYVELERTYKKHRVWILAKFSWAELFHWARVWISPALDCPGVCWALLIWLLPQENWLFLYLQPVLSVMHCPCNAYNGNHLFTSWPKSAA